MGPELMTLLGSNEEIQPGYGPSYQLCKTLYLQHPLGSKIVDKPIVMAQSQPREVSIPAAPDMVKAAYLREWQKMGATKVIRNTVRLARIYGISTLATMFEGEDPKAPLDYKNLWKKELSFNCLDPLNTAGSLVLDQDPLSMTFQHPVTVRVSGRLFNKNRVCIVMNEAPIYIDYQSSTFGFTGRSVFQRSLFPLKTFLQTMRTDDLVAVKAGVIVAKIVQPGSVIDDAMQWMFNIKRNLVGEARTADVLSISPEEEIETLNFQNLEGPMTMARRNCLENVASSTPMPAKLLNEETFAEGFGEGTEDAKSVARFIDQVREDMDAIYKFMEKICFFRAINPDFYLLVQKQFEKEYGSVPFEEAFYAWQNSFECSWPNFLAEPPSELIKVDDVKLRALIALLEILMGQLSPENKAELIDFVQQNINEMKLLFGGKELHLDIGDIITYEPPAAEAAGGEFKPQPEGLPKNDSLEEFKAAVLRLRPTEKIRVKA
jgi:hypothetical protein